MWALFNLYLDFTNPDFFGDVLFGSDCKSWFFAIRQTKDYQQIEFLTLHRCQQPWPSASLANTQCQCRTHWTPHKSQGRFDLRAADFRKVWLSPWSHVEVRPCLAHGAIHGARWQMPYSCKATKSLPDTSIHTQLLEFNSHGWLKGQRTFCCSLSRLWKTAWDMLEVWFLVTTCNNWPLKQRAERFWKRYCWLGLDSPV